ncbi:MAG: DUF5119 domain-containing protein [Prevotella sp.]
MRKAITMILTILAVFSSCNKTLYNELPVETAVNVRFEWDRANPDGVETMSLYVFSETGSPYAYDFGNITGGELPLSPGLYKTTALNIDNDIIDVVTDKYETSYITTNGTSLLALMNYSGMAAPPVPSGEVPQSVRMQPYALYADTCSTLRGDDESLVMHPMSMVDTIDVRIDNINNLDRVEAMTAAISGLSAGLSISTLSPIEDLCIMPFDMTIAGENTAVSRLLVFRRTKKEESGEPEPATENMMNVYAVMDDGSKYYYSFDVTDALNDTDEETTVVQIIIPSLPLPKPTGGGFQPALGNWEEIKEDIEL